MDSQPKAALPVKTAEDTALAFAPRPFRWSTWVVVVSVGVPLLLALAAGLEAIDNNTTATGLGAGILATLVAGWPALAVRV